MDDKPLDLGKKSCASSTQSEFSSSQKQRSIKEQITPSNIAISREDFAKSVEKRRTTVQESIKSQHSRQTDNACKTLVPKNMIRGNCEKREISAVPDIKTGTKRNIFDKSASNADIEHKRKVVDDPDCSGRATEDYISSRPSTSTDASCSYDPIAIKDHLTDNYVFPFVCAYCSKGFKYSSVYEKHIRSHTGQKPFKCQHCDTRWARLSDLRRHTKVHTGERPFRCQKCNWRFPTSSNLLRHNRTHTGEKPFICRICDKAFTNKYNARNHEELHKKSKEL